jgi:hypothetical protein
MPSAHVHFNGSVNLAEAESVVREIVARVPSSVRRIPDGETRGPGNWIFFQMQKFPGWFRRGRWRLPQRLISFVRQ